MVQLMNRDRRGESRQVLGQVRDRHDAIQKIERQMIELAELFNDMERMVVEQEPQVQQIEQGAVETHTNVVKANTELTAANDSARAARRKKWICFWIVGKCDSLAGIPDHMLIMRRSPHYHYCRCGHRHSCCCNEEQVVCIRLCVAAVHFRLVEGAQQVLNFQH